MSPVLVRELRKGSWYLVIHHGGKRYTFKVADNKDDAMTLKREVDQKILENGYSALDAFKPKGKAFGWTVSGYADKWIAEITASGLKPATVDSYESNLRLHIKPYFGALPLVDVTYGRVKEFVSSKLTETYAYGSKKAKDRPTRGYSKDSIRIMIATLSAMLQEAVREELIEVNPVHSVGRIYAAVEKMRDKPDPFDLKELHALEAVSGEWLPMTMFQSRTGARIGEAIALMWTDIDWRKCEAIIQRTMPINRKIGKPKTISSTRTVELSPELVETLKAHQAKLREEYFKEGKEAPEWVFPTRAGNPQSHSNFRRSMNRLQRLAKIRQRRPHDLRHTFACHQLAAGKPLTWVAGQLGHKSPAVTLAVYARWVPGSDSGRKDVLDKSTKHQQTSTGIVKGL